MKILVITQYYYPEDFRVNDICEELAKRGHAVTVVTGIPNYPKGEIFEGYEESYKTVEVRNRVEVIRCNNKPRRKGTLNLLINYFTYVKKANKIIKKLPNNFDIVYVYGLSPITLAIPGIKYKKLNKVPLYLYCLDIWPESIREVRMGKLISTKNPIYLFTKIISKKIYKECDLIGVKCADFINYLNKNCDINENKCKILYEHAESNYLEIPENSIDNKIMDFMFLGNIGSTSNCELIIEAAKLIKEKKFQIHFVGDGSNLTNLKNMVNKYELKNKIIFHGRCSQQDVLDYYKYADVCLLTLSNRSSIGLTIPGKLTSYMASCKPIIAAIDGDSQNIIVNSNCGYCVNSNDVNGFAKLMTQVIDGEISLNDKGKNGREYFKKHFLLKEHINKLEKQFRDLIKKGEK